MSKHGPQFDEFHAQSGEHHGGAVFDEHHGGPSANAGTDAVTQTYREASPGTRFGPLWDQTGWKQMPEHYGRFMDSNFREHAAHTGPHGTWMDVFSGGTEVRADVGGIAGTEAVVIECHPDHAVLELRRPRHADGGGRVEVNIGQIREWRHATQQGQSQETRKPAAHPGNTTAPKRASAAEAPSAHNRRARGGGRHEVDVGEATSGTRMTVKTDEDNVDVAKLAPTHTCGSCGKGSYVKSGANVYHHAGGTAGNRASSCSCGAKLGGRGGAEVPIGKSIDDTLVDLRKLAGLEA